MSRNKTSDLVIRYVEKYVADEDGISMPVYKTKKTTKSCVQRYMCCQHKLAKLTKCAEMLLRFITEEMDQSNNICHSVQLRRKFGGQMKVSCNLVYVDDTIKKAFYELVNHGLIVSYGIKTDYTVNPLYYFKGSEKSREIIITHLLRKARNPNPGSNIKQALGI